MVLLIKYVFLALLFFPLSIQSVECANSRCYTNIYNSVNSRDFPYVDRVKDIYRNLTRVIGSQQAIQSKLYLIDTDGYPWAVALMDNSVVLTHGALQSMYAEGDIELGDARVAFVLGHELSHLGTQDLFHHRSFLANRGSKEKLALGDPQPGEELRADLRGYTFATIAGYRTDRLIGEENDFFRHWLSQISGKDPTHPDNETRRRNLVTGFQRTLDDIPYYWFGVALAHFGNYEDAQYLLTDHLNTVETYEGQVNLAYVHIQRARELMPPSVAYKYWLPTLLEPNSVFSVKTRTMFDEDIPLQSIEHLERAEQLLKHSISMDDGQLVSHLNMAAVYLYLPKKTHRAYASIIDAKNTELGQVRAVRDQIESVYQLIRLEDENNDGDVWPHARETMLKIADKPHAPDNLVFNLARMLDDRGRDDAATLYWQRLHKRLFQLPIAYQREVCKRLEVNSCDEKGYMPMPSLEVKMPSETNINDRKVSKYLDTHWNSARIPGKYLNGISAQVYSNDDGDHLLTLDDDIEMIIIRNVPERYSTLSRIQKNFGIPLATLPVPGGLILSFHDWSALVKQEKVAEIWISKVTR